MQRDPAAGRRPPLSRRRPTLTELLARGAVDEALALVDAALDEQPGEPVLMQRRAEILGTLGRTDEACEALIGAADHMASRGFGTQAIRALERARAIDADAPGLAERLATVAALEHLDDVSTSPMFEMFMRDELVAVIRELGVLAFEPGEILLFQGQPGRSLYIIASGSVRVYGRGDDGWPVPLALLRAPQFFGEIALLDGGTRNATVVAASAVRVLELTDTGLANVATTEPRVMEVLRTFADQRAASNANLV